MVMKKVDILIESEVSEILSNLQIMFYHKMIEAYNKAKKSLVSINLYEFYNGCLAAIRFIQSNDISNVISYNLYNVVDKDLSIIDSKLDTIIKYYNYVDNTKLKKDAKKSFINGFESTITMVLDMSYYCSKYKKRLKNRQR